MKRISLAQNAQVRQSGIANNAGTYKCAGGWMSFAFPTTAADLGELLFMYKVVAAAGTAAEKARRARVLR